MVKRALVIAVVLLLVACGREEGRRGEVVDQANAVKILESTPWLDRAPQAEEDVIDAWVFPRGEGLYFHGNAYKGSYELFRYFVEEDEIKLRFLDDGKSHTIHFKIEKVDDRVFDYKLTFDHSPRGPKVYYGFDHQGRADLPEAVRTATNRIDRLPR